MTKVSAAFLLSATATIPITGSIIAAHVLSPEFKQFLINLTGHHWISVSIIAAILFTLYKKATELHELYPIRLLLSPQIKHHQMSTATRKKSLKR
jgi:hypothetical protein